MAEDKLTMQDVLKRFYPEYMKSHKASAVQAKAVYHITNCKTGAFGANISQCESCGYKIYHNNSCGNRSCPMCQALSNEIWVDAQNEYVLDIDYYHVVMTCPSELYPLIYGNQKEMYKLFFHAAAETMMELSKDISDPSSSPICSIVSSGYRLFKTSNNDWVFDVPYSLDNTKRHFLKNLHTLCM